MKNKLYQSLKKEISTLKNLIKDVESHLGNMPRLETSDKFLLSPEKVESIHYAILRDKESLIKLRKKLRALNERQMQHKAKLINAVYRLEREMRYQDALIKISSRLDTTP